MGDTVSTDRLQQLQDELTTHLQRETISVETKLWATERLETVRPAVLGLVREGAYEDFLLSYLQRERARRHDRATPLCRCGWECPITLGELPLELRRAADIDDGVRAFKREHAAQPVVLDEARQAWVDRVSRAERALREVYAALTSDAIPSDEQLTTPAAVTLAEPASERDAAPIEVSVGE